MGGGPMAQTNSSVSRPVTPRGRALPLILAALAVAGAAAALVSWRMASPSAPRRAARLLAISSPYANTRADVGYVGDAACARCHAGIAASYRRHPMGRSLSPISATEIPEIAAAADGRPLF